MENINKRDKREFLKHYKSTWNNGKTKTIRIPEVFYDDVSNYARQIDNDNPKYEEIYKYYEYLMAVKEKLESKEKGYSRNNSGKLITELLEIIQNQFLSE